MVCRSALRASQIALVAILAVVTLGATDSSARLYKDSHTLMCVCGCNELLGECNHLGCEDSAGMRAQLVASIAQGKDDNTIFRDFQKQYGPVVLAAPMFTRFNHLAWIMPPLVLFLGIGVTMLIVRKWRLHTVPLPPTPTTPGSEAIRRRIRNETQL